jgi:5-formyltetrahydrofolate cyclo-ligase
MGLEKASKNITSIDEAKQNRSFLRRDCRARSALLGPERRTLLTQEMADGLASLFGGFHQRCVVAVYWPIHTEPNLGFFWSRLRDLGFILALPRVVAKDAPLEFARWDESTALVPNKWHIPEVDCNQSALPFKQIGVVVMPCVGFWRTCHRLGYGGGFYDRTLAMMRQNKLAVQAVGVGFDECLLSDGDRLTTDQPCDWVVTPSQIYSASESRSTLA